MAKTIKEMAKEAVEIKHVEWSYKNMARGWYEEGANAVLEIFKEIIENRNFCAFPKSVHQELLDKIKELKGE